MKFILVGYGKMGRLLESRLLEKGHEITAVVETRQDEAAKLLPSGAVAYNALEKALDGEKGKSLKDADAAIEFTEPGSAARNLRFLIGEKIPVVTGTTGWYAELDEITKEANSSSSSLLWSSNFSLGVNLFYRIVSFASGLVDPFDEYDAAAFEIHHNKKADSPSGTARTLVETALANMKRKTRAVYGTPEKAPARDELHCASLRVGSVPGTHSLVFDSQADTIEIKHTARSREGFASGAVLAAEWLAAKKRTGVFTMDDVLAGLLPL